MPLDFSSGRGLGKLEKKDIVDRLAHPSVNVGKFIHENSPFAFSIKGHSLCIC